MTAAERLKRGPPVGILFAVYRCERPYNVFLFIPRVICHGDNKNVSRGQRERRRRFSCVPGAAVGVYWCFLLTRPGQWVQPSFHLHPVFRSVIGTASRLP